ncbi:Uncharacterized protein PECH_006129 [Penicillium ucsense]|uniref:Protein FYV10 n=1 Tax=Penicillium ucsense TaxID=2839758 RepID=A0A8J8W170_9EURO|nr:Uncharacterized protein PECM_006602 [Penicillium ucsense]KAF7735776.1 Uncharacterized protein PECH_006129 [Penicillium ucsense]
MRPDGLSSTNGLSQGLMDPVSGKAGLNGQATPFANGGSQSNGAGKPLMSSYFGHNREEVTRILIQSLYELGYDRAASCLSSESGYQLETPGVATFRSAILNGRWSEAERILIRSFRNMGLNEEERDGLEKIVVLVEHASRNEMLFYLRQQKFLELLESRDLASALQVLRQELTPLNFDVDRLHALSSLLMCPTELLHEQAGWEGPTSSSRERLLATLSKSISPSVMIPQHRLAILLDYVKQGQISNCLYHNTAEPPSLYSDHMCNKEDFPSAVSSTLNQHVDEVWHCGFSHDGTKLVTAGQDRNVLIYDTSTFTVIHRLVGHTEGIAFASWSPDDTKLITCSQDTTARVWNTETGNCLLTITHHSHPVTAAGWAPDGQSFITSSLDVNSSLCHWSMRGTSLHTWKEGFRTQDCAISPDGRRVVAADTLAKIHVFDFHSHEKEYCLSLQSKATSVTISQDSKHMLVNLADGEIQLIDIDTTTVIRRFRGHQQGKFVIRSVFGGAAENFVVSGSEDSKIYVWHKENGTLVETLEAHTKECVNSISWSPTNPGMFVSAGDDKTVRI